MISLRPWSLSETMAWKRIWPGIRKNSNALNVEGCFAFITVNVIVVKQLVAGKVDIMKGKIPENMLGPVIDSLPVELTLIDADDKIIMWSNIKREIFHRSDDILGKDIRECHPEKSQNKLNMLLAGMKSGAFDNQVMVIDCKGPDGEPAKVRIEYLALRDSQGKYTGCLELCNYLD